MNDDALAPHLEQAAMVHRNVKNETTIGLDLETLAIAKLPTHPNPVDSEVAARQGMVLVRTAQLPHRKRLPASSQKQSLAMYKWETVERMKTPKPRWRE